MNVCIYKGAPVITPEAINQTLIEGDTAIFTFKATGTPIPTLSWYFNGAPVEKSNVKRYAISEMLFNPITKNTTLAITNVELSDIGTYTCSAINTVSSYYSYGVLTINGKLSQITIHACTLSFNLTFCVHY